MTNEFTHRCRIDTPYYTFGPEQGHRPDGTSRATCSSNSSVVKRQLSKGEV